MSYLIAVGLTLLVGAGLIGVVVVNAVHHVETGEGVLFAIFSVLFIALISVAWAGVLLERSPSADEMFESVITAGPVVPLSSHR